MPALTATTSEYAAAKEWPAYNGGLFNTHYSSLNQINRGTVSDLAVAWIYSPNEGTAFANEFNPLMVNNTLYVRSAVGTLSALSPATGEKRWSFTPDEKTMVPMRGVSYWRNPDFAAGDRLFLVNGNALYAIDARSGKAVKAFGRQGRIDMGVNASSPGVIYKDVLIVGSSGGARGPGQIRAYDTRSGRVRWVFRTIPRPGEPGYETWGEQGAAHALGANAWTGMSLDPGRGVVYVATSAPKVEAKASDFYAGDWPGRNRFANSVIALKAGSGELLWDFQETYHDIWDLDLPAPPNLVRVQFRGKDIDAVAQVTKRGNVLLLNRDTGAQLYPSMEKAAPASGIPGERAWPVQRVFETPEPFAKTTFSESDITDLNAKAHNDIRTLFKKSRSGWFEPPSLEGTIYFGVFGGAQWGGASFDPESHLLYVNSNHLPWLVQMEKRPHRSAQANPRPDKFENNNASDTVGKALYQQNCAICHGQDMSGQGHAPSLKAVASRLSSQEISGVIATGRGMMPSFAKTLGASDVQSLANYLVRSSSTGAESAFASAYITTPTGQAPLKDEEGYPGSKPPWGTLNAINLDSGKILWRVPLGEYKELTKRGIPPTGTANFGGSLVTSGGLVFIAATLDGMFRAFDKKTGELLWETKLPFAGHATPATYEIDGRQFIVITASGGSHYNSPRGDTIIAFALKKHPQSIKVGKGG